MDFSEMESPQTVERDGFLDYELQQIMNEPFAMETQGEVPCVDYQEQPKMTPSEELEILKFLNEESPRPSDSGYESGLSPTYMDPNYGLEMFPELF